MDFEKIRPVDIETRSFQIISEELREMGKELDPVLAPIIKRCIHTSADFDYAQNLKFSEGAVEKAREALRRGACIVTDTQMGKAGINKNKLADFGSEVYCFIADEDVAAEAEAEGITRAAVSMRKASRIPSELIFAIGNAPTALIELDKLIREGEIEPALIIGAPVGFVNVIQAKELIMEGETPFIVVEGRKGGSNIAAAICNSLIYGMDG